jgi:hypothetical protein
VYSLEGRKLLKKQVLGATQNLSLDISSIGSGTYIISFSDGITAGSRIIVVSN